jgi:hypothetical protein
VSSPVVLCSNPPEQVARLFAEVISEGHARGFSRIVCAIKDATAQKSIIGPFSCLAAIDHARGASTAMAAQCRLEAASERAGEARLQAIVPSNDILLYSTRAPKIEECREQLSSQAVGHALYGLQNMSSDVQGVRYVSAGTQDRRVNQERN